MQDTTNEKIEKKSKQQLEFEARHEERQKRKKAASIEKEKTAEELEHLKLVDEKDGKEVDWAKHKKIATMLEKSYLRLGNEERAIKVNQCGTSLIFKQFSDMAMKLHTMISCQYRLCGMCAWRRSLKIFGQVSKVMNHMNAENEYEYLFLSFTIRNVKKEDIKESLDRILYGFNKMTKSKAFKNLSKGWFRALELTYNNYEFITSEMWFGNKLKKMEPMQGYFKKHGLKIGDPNPNYDTYHPHYHMIIAVNKSYTDDAKIRLNQKQWAELWQSCFEADYLPVVKLLNFKESKKGLGKEVAEVAKYTVKMSDVFFNLPSNVNPESEQGKKLQKKLDDKTDELVSVFDTVLANRRLIGFGGKFKEVHKMLNLDNPEDGDLINTDGEDSSRADMDYILVKYNWNVGFGNYYFDSVVEKK